MEVLSLVCAGIDVVHIWRSCGANPGTASHVVEDDIYGTEGHDEP